MHGLATSTTSTWQCVVVPGENTPELAVTKDDLNTGGHYNRPPVWPACSWGTSAQRWFWLDHTIKEFLNVRILESESEWMIAHLVVVRYGRERRVLHDGCGRRRSRLWPWTAASRRTTAAVCWCRWRIAASAPPSPCLPATHPRWQAENTTRHCWHWNLWRQAQPMRGGANQET